MRCGAKTFSMGVFKIAKKRGDVLRGSSLMAAASDAVNRGIPSLPDLEDFALRHSFFVSRFLWLFSFQLPIAPELWDYLFRWGIDCFIGCFPGGGAWDIPRPLHRANDDDGFAATDGSAANYPITANFVKRNKTVF